MSILQGIAESHTSFCPYLSNTEWAPNDSNVHSNLDVFSETLLFLHQIFLKGLLARMENWPTLVLGEYCTTSYKHYVFFKPASFKLKDGETEKVFF